MALCGSGMNYGGDLSGADAATGADCTKIVQGTRTVSVPCTQNVCRTIKVPTTRQMTRYRQEPRSYTYQSTEIRTRPKVVKQPRQIMVSQMTTESKTIMVPKQIMVPKVISVPKSIQVPKTIFVDVTTTEQYSAPVTKVGTRQVTVPYQVTVPAYRLANKCDQVTKIVRRQVPVFNVVAKQGPAPVQGIRYLSGEPIIDQEAAAPILAEHSRQEAMTAAQVGGMTGAPSGVAPGGTDGAPSGVAPGNTTGVSNGVATGASYDIITGGMTGTTGASYGMPSGAMIGGGAAQGQGMASGAMISGTAQGMASGAMSGAAQGMVGGSSAYAQGGGAYTQSFQTGGFRYATGAGLVVRNDTQDLDGDGVTTANEAARFATGERRVDLVQGGMVQGGMVQGGMVGGGMSTAHASGGAVGGVRDLNGDGVLTQAEAAAQGVSMQRA